MKPQQALEVLDKIASDFQGNRDQHAILQQALITLQEAIKPKEVKKKNGNKGTSPPTK